MLEELKKTDIGPPGTGWDAKEHSLGLGALLGSVSQAAVSHYSFETIELFREAMARLFHKREATRFQTADSHPLELTTYAIELRFNQLADEADRRFFNSVPTSLQLPPSTVDRLKRLAAVELKKNPEFQRLIQDLGCADEASLSKDSFTEGAKSGSLSLDASEAIEQR